MLRVTNNLMMPTAITGSYPRPLWFTAPYLLSLRRQGMRKPDKRKSYDLDEATMKQVQRLLGAKTETEAIKKALELVTDEVRLAQALTHLLDKGKGPLHDPTGFLKALAVDVGRSPVARAV